MSDASSFILAFSYSFVFEEYRYESTRGPPALECEGEDYRCLPSGWTQFRWLASIRLVNYFASFQRRNVSSPFAEPRIYPTQGWVASFLFRHASGRSFPNSVFAVSLCSLLICSSWTGADIFTSRRRYVEFQDSSNEDEFEKERKKKKRNDKSSTKN